MNSKEVAEKFRKKYVLNEGTINVGDKVKYLEKPMQGADFFLETEPTEVVKVNSKTVVFNNRRTSIPIDRVYPYSGYKKITGGKKNGRQMWVPKNKLNEAQKNKANDGRKEKFLLPVKWKEDFVDDKPKSLDKYYKETYSGLYSQIFSLKPEWMDKPVKSEKDFKQYWKNPST